MAYYHSSLQLSARHAHKLCIYHMDLDCESLTHSKNRLCKLQSQRNDMLFKKRISEYNLDQVLRIDQEINELENIIRLYESVISDLKQTANSILDAITLLGKNHRKKYDYDTMLESCQFAIYLFKEKIALYQSKNSGYTQIIKNIAAPNNADTTSVNANGLYMNIKYNQRRIDELTQDIIQMNKIIGIISQHRELQKTQLQIQNAECNISGNVR